ncbi:porin family protein [Flavitalea flava]
MNCIYFPLKRVILIILAFLSLNGYAQLNFGIKGGSNITTIRDVNEFAPWKISYYAGLYATLPINKKFFLDAELYYSRKGNKITVVRGLGNFRIDYLCAPLLAGFNLSKKLSILLGPEFGFLVRVRTADYSPDINEFARFDLGLDGGLSYKAGKRLSLDIRYVYGLMPLLASERLEYINGNPTYYPVRGFARLRNRVFQVGLAYRISS